MGSRGSGIAVGGGWGEDGGHGGGGRKPPSIYGNNQSYEAIERKPPSRGAPGVGGVGGVGGGGVGSSQSNPGASSWFTQDQGRHSQSREGRRLHGGVPTGPNPNPGSSLHGGGPQGLFPSKYGGPGGAGSGQEEDAARSALPRIHDARQHQEASTDSFLADYLSTLDKQGHPAGQTGGRIGTGNRKHGPADQDEPRSSSGGGYSNSNSHAGGGGNKAPMPFFKKPQEKMSRNGGPYDLGGGGNGGIGGPSLGRKKGGDFMMRRH